MENNNEQEVALKFQMFEQQIRMIQEQLQAVEQATIELGSLNLDLDELIGKTNKELFAPVGRGIYINATLISEELLVDIGNKNFVKKSIPETKKILQEQLKKLEKAREELNAELEKINIELTDVFMQHQGELKHAAGCDHENCECGDECDCGEDCKCEK
jgi:prefoldin alpha subunit